MKATETRLHQETWALLPWLANGRADAAQRRRAESHLAECADCRAELAREQRMTAAMALPSMTGPDLSQGMARLMQRIDHAETVRAEAGHSLALMTRASCVLAWMSAGAFPSNTIAGVLGSMPRSSASG